MRKISVTLLALLAFGLNEWAYAQANFNTSLHGTRNGKPYFYNKVENGGTGGFETFTNVPITSLGCVECHDAVDANGNPYPANFTPGCADCHATNSGWGVTQTDCLGCHGRETAIINMGFTDVHRSAGFTCVSCHKKEELHGDSGIEHNSLFDTGAIQADCSNSGCHAGFAHSNPAVDPHAGKLHCTSCHAQSNLACYSCHFESQVNNHLKRPQRQITGFIMLVNRTKDNKVHPATFQSITYQGQAGIVIAPSVAHTIVKTGARTCTDCHKNFGGTIPAINDYDEDGILKFATWNNADSTLSWQHGIVPIPADYERSLIMDYLKYDGNTSDPIAPSKNWSVVKEDADLFQMLYCTPLSSSQMSALGMNITWLPVELASFNASVNGLNVFLNWITASELNNSGFEIQKKVAGKFITVGFVKGNGTTTEQHQYSYTDKHSQPGKYIYRLKQIDFNGSFEYSKEVEANVIYGLTYFLDQNYPNPFNPTTKISYSIPQSGYVNLKVYDALGNLVKELVSEQKDAGYFDVQFDGSNLSSGIYYYQIKVGNFTDTKKLVIMK